MTAPLERRGNVVELSAELESGRLELCQDELRDRILETRPFSCGDQ